MQKKYPKFPALKYYELGVGEQFTMQFKYPPKKLQPKKEFNQKLGKEVEKNLAVQNVKVQMPDGSWKWYALWMELWESKKGKSTGLQLFEQLENAPQDSTCVVKRADEYRFIVEFHGQQAQPQQVQSEGNPWDKAPQASETVDTVTAANEAFGDQGALPTDENAPAPTQQDAPPTKEEEVSFEQEMEEAGVVEAVKAAKSIEDLRALENEIMGLNGRKDFVLKVLGAFAFQFFALDKKQEVKTSDEDISVEDIPFGN